MDHGGICLDYHVRISKEKTRQLGSSTEELEGTVASLTETLEHSEAQQRALVERIQNLEAIVTSQTWDALHDDALPTSEKERRLASSRILLDEPDNEPSDAQKTAQLARRLKV
ncbi:MAG: hypothetical protein ACR2GR_02870 [Rhodothermales bacterium]